jgi:hypothetical protein
MILHACVIVLLIPSVTSANLYAHEKLLVTTVASVSKRPARVDVILVISANFVRRLHLHAPYLQWATFMLLAPVPQITK